MRTKSYEISKQEVEEAWKRVKKNRGAGGVDGVTVSDFEAQLEDNLYKLWNRMSSGSYFPQAVRRVEIGKPDGSTRPLGIPTVNDRVAQEVVRARLERKVDPLFHKDSYGFRPKKSAHEAVGRCRERNFDYDWVVDLDISKYFDTINHDLLMKAVRKHCEQKWMLMYIERWLKSNVVLATGETMTPEAGTPQGGVISPLLANLFLHYAFDMWMTRNHTSKPFERYADDAVIHCRTQKEAESVLAELNARFAECHLKLHPEKTKIVYCKDSYRRENPPVAIQYDFLGFTFRGRKMISKRKGTTFTRFLPSASQKAKKRLRKKVKGLVNGRTTKMSFVELTAKLNLILRGWYNYYSKFSYYGNLRDLWLYIQVRLTNWLQRKIKANKRKVTHWLKLLRTRKPDTFAHWHI